MGYMKGGLAHFSDGNTTSDVADEKKDDTIGTAKSQPVKIGKYITLPPTTGTTPIKATALENLQKEYEARKAEKSGFLERMKDAQAWLSGGIYGPTQGLQARNEERARQAAELFQMQNAIEGYKAQQERNKARLSQLGFGGTQPTIAGGATQPTAGDTVATTPIGGVEPTAGTTIPQWRQIVNSLPVALQTQAYEALQEGDTDKFDAIVKEATLKRSELEKNIDAYNRMPPGVQKELFARQIFPEGFKTQVYVDPKTGEKYEYSVQGTYPGSTDSKIVVKPAGETKTGVVGAKDAIAAGVPVISGQRSNEKQWELYDAWVAGGRKGNPVARPGTSQHETGNALDVNMKTASAENIKWLKDNGYVQPLPKTDPNHWEKSTATVNTTTTTTAPTGPKSIQQQEKEKSIFQSNLDIDKKSAEKFMENTDMTVLADRESQNTSLEQWIKRWGHNKRIVGLTNDPTLANAVIDVLEQGIHTPTGQISIGGIEDAVQKLIPGTSKAEVEARQELQQLLGRRVLDVVRRSKGSTSDKDWLAFKQIAGSTKNGIDLINKLQKYDLASIKLDKADRELYNSLPENERTFSRHAQNKQREKLYKDFMDETTNIAKSKFVQQEAPKRPSNVPAGAKYSPSTNTWWFNGKQVG